MANSNHFAPPKRSGLILHSLLMVVLATAAIWGFISLTRVEMGMQFLISLLATLVSFVPLPLLAYRAYALQQADYVLDRESLAIKWGLRAENIPLSDIEFMRPASDLTIPLRLPRFSLYGSIVGVRRHPDLGTVEFLASDRKRLLLVGTARRVFVISPNDPAGLARNFARATEMGSLTPVQPVSVYPSFVVNEAWTDKSVRFLWLTTIFLNLALFVWASLVIPSMPSVLLGNVENGQAVPSSQLIILPVTSLLLSVMGHAAGLYFYRWEKERPLAFILWFSNLVMSLSFLIAGLFIHQPPM